MKVCPILAALAVAILPPNARLYDPVLGRFLSPDPMKNAVTIGNFIVGQKDLVPDPNNSTFQHEYGHYIQSQAYGLFYISDIAIPSLMSVKKKYHGIQWYEREANILSYPYFTTLKRTFEWDHKRNPFSTNSY